MLSHVVTMNKPRLEVTKRPRVVQSSGDWCAKHLKTDLLVIISRIHTYFTQFLELHPKFIFGSKLTRILIFVTIVHF